MDNPRRKILHDFVDVVIDNLALIITIVSAGVVLYRHDIANENISTEDLLTAILWVLGLLAISEIVERYRKLNAIHKSVDRSITFLESRFTDRPSAMAFFQDKQEIRPFIQRATQIDLCGVTLTNTLNKEYGTLLERLQSGANIRILIIEPEPVALEMSARRSSNPEDVDYYRNRLNSSLHEISYLYKLYKNEREFKSNQSGGTSGSISVRFLSYAPSFGVAMIDVSQNDGIIFVEVYPHKFGYVTPPLFDLTKQRDLKWYDYFRQQYEDMWNTAKTWEPEKYIEKIPFPKEK
jgi:hypothetical protein